MSVDSLMSATPAAGLASPQGSEPLISIVIPAYNYARFLPEAIGSALAQTYGRTEVIVVDDGSTDNTPEVVKPFLERIHYHRKINGGLSAARNTGTELAKGEFLIFLDADDLLLPEMAAHSWHAVRDGSCDIQLVASMSLIMDHLGQLRDEDHPAPLTVNRFIQREDLVVTSRFPVPSLIRKQALLDIGGFDTSLRSTEDRDMWIKIASRGKVLFLGQPLSVKRLHGENMSNQARKQTATMRVVISRGLAATHPASRRFVLSLRAWSAYYWSSARLYRDEGAMGRALWEVTSSLLLWPWFLSYDSASLGGYNKPCFRLAFILVTLLRWARSLGKAR